MQCLSLALQWEEQSYAANKAKYSHLDYSLIEASTHPQNNYLFSGPFPQGSALRFINLLSRAKCCSPVCCCLLAIIAQIWCSIMVARMCPVARVCRRLMLPIRLRQRLRLRATPTQMTRRSCRSASRRRPRSPIPSSTRSRSCSLCVACRRCPPRITVLTIGPAAAAAAS